MNQKAGKTRGFACPVRSLLLPPSLGQAEEGGFAGAVGASPSALQSFRIF